MVKVYDFFSGCGGTSLGFRQAGFDIVWAIDNDPDSVATFEHNFPESSVSCEDINGLDPKAISPFIFPRNDPLLFCGCAPCQPFSKQNNAKSTGDPRRNLLRKFSEFVKYWKPEFIVVENVPGLQKVTDGGPFDSFIKDLLAENYSVRYSILRAAHFGVPQRRDRLVLVASLEDEAKLPVETHGEGAGSELEVVRNWISDLPPLRAGEQCPEDPDHHSAQLSDLNLRRIKATPTGCGRESWPPDLWLNCHKTHVGHSDVYGRMHWDKTASGLTTRCISLSNGRFGHPEQDRAISVREAACLQTFPREFSFRGLLNSKARQVGNAVPPHLAKQIGMALVRQ
ncbi:DNA (cytosine-5)-methyltransferase 1 [Halospina denitrificans]|uniref:DNA (cytosine-5-)-methyltransferase n=1 Tax=Halospina denitrificans TaxID=332522 RepID=A0A4R7JIH4_9GAMM|nr:DNA (cytosine-5)-methyltransferase 1 [Halospina denitrificans]